MNPMMTASTLPAVAPRRAVPLAVPLCAAFAALAGGCVTTEALYAEYDEHACLASPLAPAPLALALAEPALVAPAAAPPAVDTDADVEVDALALVAPDGVGTMRWEPMVTFGFDRHVLDDVSRERLDRDVAVLRAYPELRLSVRGFTDRSGSIAYNRSLSQRRVRNVADYLRARGIAGSRLHTAPLGETLPLVNVARGSRVPPNRRVELMLIDAKGIPVPLRLEPLAADGSGLRKVPVADEADPVDAPGSVDDADAAGAADAVGNGGDR